MVCQVRKLRLRIYHFRHKARDYVPFSFLYVLYLSFFLFIFFYDTGFPILFFLLLLITYLFESFVCLFLYIYILPLILLAYSRFNVYPCFRDPTYARVSRRRENSRLGHAHSSTLSGMEHFIHDMKRS